MWGCEGGATMPIRMAGEDQHTCPRRPIMDDPEGFAQAFQLYGLYDKGVLLEDGGFHDQPHIYTELMGIIGGAVSEAREFEMEERKRQSSSKTPSAKRRRG